MCRSSAHAGQGPQSHAPPGAPPGGSPPSPMSSPLISTFLSGRYGSSMRRGISARRFASMMSRTRFAPAFGSPFPSASMMFPLRGFAPRKKSVPCTLRAIPNTCSLALGAAGSQVKLETDERLLHLLNRRSAHSRCEAGAILETRFEQRVPRKTRRGERLVAIRRIRLSLECCRR